MDKLHLNLSEEEFSRSRKILLWIFVVAFFLGGTYVALLSPVFGIHHIKPSLSAAPYGISLMVGIIAVLATIKRKNLYFIVDDEKIEFRYGLFRTRKKSFPWTEINELVMPSREKKVKLLLKNGSFYVINLIWLQRKKTSIIRKYIYQKAISKGLKIRKVKSLNGITAKPD